MTYENPKDDLGLGQSDLERERAMVDLELDLGHTARSGTDTGLVEDDIPVAPDLSPEAIAEIVAEDDRAQDTLARDLEREASRGSGLDI